LALEEFVSHSPNIRGSEANDGCSEKEELEMQLREVPELEKRIAELEAVVRDREREV
jgi:hypothetical protein